MHMSRSNAGAGVGSWSGAGDDESGGGGIVRVSGWSGAQCKQLILQIKGIGKSPGQILGKVQELLVGLCRGFHILVGGLQDLLPWFHRDGIL